MIKRFPSLPALAGALSLLAVAAGLAVTQSSAEEARLVPPPAVDEAAGATAETAVLAGGCFWGVQGVFQHVKGVTGAVSGYAGGDAQSAQYETVSGGGTGHAEVGEDQLRPAPGSAMAASCRSTSRWRTTRPS